MSAVSQAINSGHHDASGIEYVAVFQGIVLTHLLVVPSLIPLVASMPRSRLREVVNEQLHPSPWHGLTWNDIYFAALVMTIGLRISLTMHSLHGRLGVKSPYPHILCLTGLLFFLGLLANGILAQGWSDIRLAGGMQRIAICYLVGSIFYLNATRIIRYALVPTILIGYWYLMAYVPMSDGKAGDFTFDGNLANWIDQRYLPSSRLYGAWDPDGLLTTLPAIASCVIGTVWGDLHLSRLHPNTKLWLYFVGGIAAMNGGVICNSQLPINRSLWTPSFVMVTAGVATILLGACYFLVDTSRLRRSLMPFRVIGQNFLFAFLLMTLLPLGVIAARPAFGKMKFWSSISSPLFEAVFEMLLIWLVLYGGCRLQRIAKVAVEESKDVYQ